MERSNLIHLVELNNVFVCICTEEQIYLIHTHLHRLYKNLQKQIWKKKKEKEKKIFVYLCFQILIALNVLNVIYFAPVFMWSTKM